MAHGIILRRGLQLSPSAFRKYLVLVLRPRLGRIAADAAGMPKHLPLIEAQEVVEPRLPVAQEYLLLPLRLILRKIQEHHHDPVQR